MRSMAIMQCGHLYTYHSTTFEAAVRLTPLGDDCDYCVDYRGKYNHGYANLPDRLREKWKGLADAKG